jgi:purine-nucleoside phosphorylase
MDLTQRIMEAGRALNNLLPDNTEDAIILGSGLGILADSLSNRRDIPFSAIDGMHVPRTEGHKGMFYAGDLDGVPILMMSGRMHLYDGLGLGAVTYPVRVMKAAGIRRLVITNAAGAINPGFSPGSLMMITDHLNLTGTNPLWGDNLDAFDPRFPDSTDIWTERLRDVCRAVSDQQGIPLQEGVYAWWSGPTYETPAEIRMIGILGADAVGMSSVPEALVASHMGMDVLGLSVLSNKASGLGEGTLSHGDVLEKASEVSGNVLALVRGCLARFV